MIGPVSQELLPCPFCGGEGEVHSTLPFDEAPTQYWAECLSCGGGFLPKGGRAEAIAAWNTRHQSTARLAEALEQAREALEWAQARAEKDLLPNLFLKTTAALASIAAATPPSAV
jgi:Lar family restriction alleviation protein